MAWQLSPQSQPVSADFRFPETRHSLSNRFSTRAVPMADWQPRAAVQQMAEAQGWTVRRIKIDDGCYEIDATDADGRAFEVKVDPATLAIVELEFED
jgi:uncharacterized membrane protein YkoI